MKSTQHFSGNLSSRSHQFNGLTVNGSAHFFSEKSKGRGKSRALARWTREDGAGSSHVGEYSFTRSRMIEDLIWENCLESLAFEGFGYREATLDTHTRGTCEWLFQTPEYLRWIEERGLFLVRGNPGSGKSTLLKFAAGKEFGNKVKPQHLVLRFLFHVSGIALQKNMEGILRSLLLQLVEQDSTSRSSFHDFCRKRMVGETAERRKIGSLRWHTNELQSIFETLVLDGSIGSKISIFVDAVDECLDQERGRLISFLHRIRGKDGERSDRPRIFLTCRLYPDGNFMKYVEEELRITGEKESEIIEFKNSLFSQTGGLFLWVILVVNRVHEMSDQGFSLRHIGSQIFKCPRELNGLYKALLESLKDEELLEAGKLFQWVRFSCRPYHLEEIRSAMTIHLDGTTKSINEFEDFKTTEYFISDEQMKKRILHLGKGLIEIADTEISQGRALVGFHHETVKDFMDTCGLQYLDSRLKEKRGLAKTADVNLANICISYLSSEDIHLASLGKSRELPSKFLFLNYAARHWLGHAVQAEVKELGSSVRWPSPQTLKTWIKVSEILDGETTEGREEGTTLMHLAADHGLLSVAKRIMGLPSKATYYIGQDVTITCRRNRGSRNWVSVVSDLIYHHLWVKQC